MKRYGFLALLVALCAASIPAQAARSFTIAQTAPVAPGEVDMGTTQTLTYTVTNTASGGNAGERIYRMRFRLSGSCTGTGCTATLFTTASAAPANWTRTGFNTTSVTYTAATWADSIPAGSSLSFSVVVTAGKSTQDRTETLRDARASYTTDTDFSNGIKNAGTSTINTPGSWILQSLQITGFQTTDTSGVPTSAIAAGATFRIVITVKNISVATLNGIVANPSPPTATTSVGFGASPNCSAPPPTTSPSPFNLAAGASGTITYTNCTTVLANSGTVTYSVTDVRIGGGAATSRTGSSNVLSVSPLSVGIAITGPYVADTTCHFSGDTATFVMTVTNNTGANVTSITPSALTRAGTNTTIGAFTAQPTSCSGAFPLPNGGWCKYTWTAPVTIIGSYPSSGAKPIFSVTGSASANPGPITSPTVPSNPQDVEGFVVTVAPTATNTDSTNEQFTFSLLNSGCANVNQVAITAPGAFPFSGDGYSLINSTAEDWTQTGTTFAAGTVLPTGASGDFSLVFTSTPSATGTYTFSLNVTDQNAVSKTVTVDVPVATFGSGTINVASPATWREVFQ